MDKLTHATQSPVQAESIDPVCGMTVNHAAGKPARDYSGVTYHFCASGCHDKFAADPYYYLSGNHKKNQQLSTSASGLYTCPMDPEIVQEGNGTCPICGMALEPMDGVAEGPNEELIDFTRRLWISVAVAVPLLILTMGAMIGFPFRSWLGETYAVWLEMILATPIVLYVAQPFFRRGWTSLTTARFNMWTLIMLGVTAAYSYSVVAAIFPGVFPAAMHVNGGVPVYFEAAVVIIALVFVGQVLELRAREKTGDAIRALLDLAPRTARRVTPDGEEYDAPLANIIEGDWLRVRPGDRVPVDALVVDGQSSVDESLMSGESLPVEKSIGSTVIGGTINKQGTLLIEAQHVGKDTVLSKIIDMVTAAQRSRAPIQGLADKVASFFVPTVVAIALVTFVIWMLAGPTPTLIYALVSSISVLIIACPCALGLATPMSIMTATGRGAQMGILVKEAGAIETLARIDTLVVDKTGTLTMGKPVVSEVRILGQLDQQTVLGYAGSLEKLSEHPLAEAVVAAAEKDSSEFRPVSNFTSVTGKGVQGDIDGSSIALGNRSLLMQLDIESDNAIEQAERLSDTGKTVMYCIVNDEIEALIAVGDPIKDTAKEVIRELQGMGCQVVMATGDDERTASHVASLIGIHDVRAALLPRQKQTLVSQLRADGRTVAVAGDGVNDAPALASANVGIAMGGGSDVAIESAGITLLHGDLTGMVRARKLATATIRNIKQNLFFAFAYNAVGIPVAAGILYPLTGTLLPPMLAAAAMSLSSVSVIANALRLRRVELG